MRPPVTPGVGRVPISDESRSAPNAGEPRPNAAETISNVAEPTSNAGERTPAFLLAPVRARRRPHRPLSGEIHADSWLRPTARACGRRDPPGVDNRDRLHDLR